MPVTQKCHHFSSSFESADPVPPRTGLPKASHGAAPPPPSAPSGPSPLNLPFMAGRWCGRATAAAPGELVAACALAAFAALLLSDAADSAGVCFAAALAPPPAC